MMPENADAVVRVEDTDQMPGPHPAPAEVRIRAAARAGLNVRRAGEDVGIGDPVLAAGTPLSAAAVASLYATIMAGAIVIASSISTAIGDIVTLHPSTESGFKFADLLLHRVSASIVANPLTVGDWLGLAAWGLVGLLTFISSGHLGEGCRN